MAASAINAKRIDNRHAAAHKNVSKRIEKMFKLGLSIKLISIFYTLLFSVIIILHNLCNWLLYADFPIRLEEIVVTSEIQNQDLLLTGALNSSP